MTEFNVRHNRSTIGPFPSRERAYNYAAMLWDRFTIEPVVPEDAPPPTANSDNNASGGVNPKDLQGIKKVPLDLLPSVGVIYGAMAAKDGALKYDPYNWRAQKIAATIYIAAMKRHIAALEDGEDTDPKSKVHHLGHVIAGASIYLDAMETGSLIDDRRKSGVVARLLEQFNQVS